MGLSVLTAGWGSGSAVAASSARLTGGTAVIATSPGLGPNWFFPMNPIQADTDINLQVQALMFKPILNITPTDGIDLARSLASHISANSAGTRYVVTLNPKWHWSNGDPVTAQDVVFTWSIMKAASAENAPWVFAGSGFGGIPSRIRSVVARGAHTVVVTLTKPSNQVWFEHNGLAQMSPVPEFVWNKYPHNMTKELSWIESVANSPGNPVYQIVDGPYRLSKYVENSYWSFSTNPHYDGHRSTLTGIIFEYETSDAAEFAALKSGTVNVGYVPDSLLGSDRLLSSDRLTPEYTFGFNFIHPNFSRLAPDHIGPVLAQLYVRQALQMGIDQTGILHTLYHGLGVPEDSPVPNQPHTIFFDPALRKNPYPFNPTRGKTLLQAHGWHLVHGVMTRNGQKLSFPVTYISGSQTSTDVAELIKSDWGREGVDVTLESLPASTFFADVTIKNPSDWAMALGGGWTYEPDYYPTGGGLFMTGAPVNKGGYSNATMNRLIEDSYLPGTSAQTLAALYRYESFAAKQLPVLWMPLGASMAAHSATLHGTVAYFNPVSDLLSPNYWWFSKS